MNTTEASSPAIVDAFAEWDDPHAFRVYLVTDDPEAEPHPMRRPDAILGDDPEAVLYRHAFCAAPKDFTVVPVGSGPFGWERKAQAERAAKAVKKGIVAMAKGAEPPSAMAIQIALAMVPRKGARR